MFLSQVFLQNYFTGVTFLWKGSVPSRMHQLYASIIDVFLQMLLKSISGCCQLNTKTRQPTTNRLSEILNANLESYTYTTTQTYCWGIYCTRSHARHTLTLTFLFVLPFCDIPGFERLVFPVQS